MQSKQSEETVNLKLRKGDESMPLDVYVRWICLLEGIDIVNKKMKQFSHRLKNQDMDWIKPLAFQKYITERFNTMKCDLEEAEKNPEQQLHLYKQKQLPICTTSLEHTSQHP
jgi:hypothetical protein